MSSMCLMSPINEKGTCEYCKKNQWVSKCASCFAKVCNMCSDVWLIKQSVTNKHTQNITEILCNSCYKDHLNSFYK